MNKYTIPPIFFIVFMLCLAIANAQESTELSIALTLTSKGNSHYQQKRYLDAIAQYTNALTYLSTNDAAVQKQLGETYTKIAESYKRIKNRKLTVSFYKKSLATYTALQNKKYMARTLNTLAEAQRHLGNYVVALDNSMSSLAIHKQLDDPIGRTKALMGAGIIYRHIGRYEQSLKHIHEAHQYYKKVNNAMGIAKTSNEMGLVFTRLKQFEQARSFYQQTIDQPANKIDAKTLATAFREMAVINLNNGHYESANVMAQKALNTYQRENDISNESLVARIIANIHRAQQNHTEAITYYKKSLSLATQIGNKIYQIKAQIPLADVLIGKNTDEAISLLKNSLVLSTQIKAKTRQVSAYRLLRQAEKLRGNTVDALRYAENEISISKELQAETQNNELVLEKAKLHSLKIEMELESLKEKTTQARIISELKLTKNQYASIALASLLAICLLAVIFISRRFFHSRKHNKELHKLAALDSLTNCYNRRILDDLLSRDFSNLDLLGEYCIILADIDHFKAVNDNHGHITGDEVIKGVANILNDGVRQNDIVARFGGEEFCLVLPGANQNQAMRIAETIRKKIESTHFNDITVTCSFGVTCIKFDAKTPAEFIEQADLALYKSKNNGRNQVTLWNQTL